MRRLAPLAVLAVCLLASCGGNSSWGYQVGCTTITVCNGRVGYDAHLPTP